ncbi:hypothetical protein MMH89_02195 [Candidatus Comchoanobacter bicostacola]|uniref:Uncharacterized protein n=1 Tax=Candidatus Comchoanobacter bicostacola TaxID=2919598 RepID=A0ABY5DKE0_9GAMM|nr:hypothetical protein [Candidatus Comchoanobacter bicostacola]UTC24958.1 hypothetical protein MMH89_02195 [Candidatus Comchoanobacter bicostacola]
MWSVDSDIDFDALFAVYEKLTGCDESAAYMLYCGAIGHSMLRSSYTANSKDMPINFGLIEALDKKGHNLCVYAGGRGPGSAVVRLLIADSFYASANTSECREALYHLDLYLMKALSGELGPSETLNAGDWRHSKSYGLIQTTMSVPSLQKKQLAKKRK